MKTLLTLMTSLFTSTWFAQTGSTGHFNDNNCAITSNAGIKQAVIRLTDEEHVADTTGTKTLSKAELRALVLQQTKPGGKLDYFTSIKGQEMDGFQFRPGLIVTRLSAALYNWGKATNDLGVESAQEALAIFAEFKGKDLNLREKDYIIRGFEKELDQ